MKVRPRCPRCSYIASSMSGLTHHLRMHDIDPGGHKSRRAKGSLRNLQTLRREMLSPSSRLSTLPEDTVRNHLSPYLSGVRGSLANQENTMRKTVRRLGYGGTRRRQKRQTRLRIKS